MLKAYRVTVTHLVVIAENDDDARYEAMCFVEDGGGKVDALTIDELHAYGDQIPVGEFEKDGELTCAEIAKRLEALRACGDGHP